MKLHDVSDPADPRLEPFRDVKDPRWLRERGQFLAEGRTVIAALAHAEGYAVRALLATDPALVALGPALGALPDATPVFRVGAELMTRVAGVRFHQGCVALGAPADPRPPDALVATLPRRALVLVLEQLSDPDNVGGLFRSAHALGAAAVLLSPGCASPLYRKASRTSMGAVFRLPFAEFGAWPDGLDALAAAGFVVVALTPEADAVSIDAFAAGRPERVALVAGNEGAGLSPGLLARASVRVRIPMVGGADSLNVATAAAIALHRLAGATG